jgi:hypothetical protein
MNQCSEHSGICERNEGVKENLKQEILDRKSGDSELWKGLNQMKAWVITGMGSTIVGMALFILNLLIPHAGK